LKVEITDIIERLRIQLNNPLPGKAAQHKMIPLDRSLEPPPTNLNINQAGVLLLLFPEDGKLKTVFIRRPSSMKNHADQMAFPGGRSELTDKDLRDTALREAVEEIGIISEQVEIIGQLSPLYVNVSNFSIQPFIGWVAHMPVFEIDKKEVTDIYIISIDDLLNPGSLQSQKVDTSLGLQEFPGYFVNDIFIWGATAMILSEFLEIYNQISII